jgi:hypothetical protein
MVAAGHMLSNAQRMVGERRAEDARQERVRSGKRFGFRVLTPLSYDGKDFAVGQIVSSPRSRPTRCPGLSSCIPERRLASWDTQSKPISSRAGSRSRSWCS